MAVAGKDQNFVSSLIAKSSANDGAIVDLWADPTTHRLLVTSASGSGTVTSISQGTGILNTPNPITTTGTVALATSLQPAASLTGNALKVLRVNAGETAVEYATDTSGITQLTGAITAGPGSGSQVASLGSFSSANLATALTDETGTGLAVFATNPVLTTPNIGSATGSVSGNAGTATALQNSRTIGGSSFDGTANVTSFPEPGAIGATTPSTGKFTSVETTGNIELGNASDTTLARSGAGDVTIEGNQIYRVGGTDVSVADGGTGASSLTANSVILGNGTSTLSGNLVAPGTSGNVLTSNGTTWASTAPAASAGKSFWQIWLSASFGATSTNYAQYTNFSTTEANCRFYIPLAGTFKNFYFYTLSAQSGTGSLVATVRKNAVATSVTTTVSAGAAAGTFSDTTHSFTVAAGDYITIEFVNNASSSSATVQTIAIEFDNS